MPQPSDKVSRAVELALKFTPEEWADFERRVKAYRQLSGDDQSRQEPRSSCTKDQSTDTILVLQEIVLLLQRLGVEFSSVELLQKSPTIKSFNEKVPGVMSYVRKGVKTRNAHRALLSLGLQLLYDRLVKEGYPAGGRTLMNNIHRLPSTVNSHFPGYAASGMLGMIIKEGSDVRKERSRKP